MIENKIILEIFFHNFFNSLKKNGEKTVTNFIKNFQSTYNNIN